MSERCGSTETESGEPCRRGVNCPYHRGPGRPTKYRPRFCERVIELGREGSSRAVIARELGVAMSTMQDWEEKHPGFRASTARARELALAWWEDQGQKGVWSREFNASAYRLQVMNRFPGQWRDKQSLEHSGPDGGAIEVDVDDARERLSNELRRIAERRASVSGPRDNGTGN